MRRTVGHWMRCGEEMGEASLARSFQLGFVDLKQVNCQLFLQQRWIYWGSVNMSHMQLLQGRGRRMLERKRKMGGIVNKESGTIHKLSPCQERRVSLLPVIWE